MEGLLVVALIVWSIARSIKKAQQRAAGQPKSTSVPAPAPQPVRRSDSPWAQMMGTGGSLLTEMLERAEKAQARPDAHPTEAKRAPDDEGAATEGTPRKPIVLRRAPGTLQAPQQPQGVTKFIPTDYASPEGVDACHEDMLNAPVAAAPSTSAASLPGLALRLDAPALVQAVILSEVLTRPAQRRRGGA
ncbi:MAG: hypothetical protein LBU67_04220 [Oscillospiraceae bacterium]|jgi:hypothetical protein|nr:hypothetical protein [Oscillospiraceae bacterium]